MRYVAALFLIGLVIFIPLIVLIDRALGFPDLEIRSFYEKR